MAQSNGKCPECKSQSAEAYKPFCSKRCADIDLGRWLTGAYVIASHGADDDEDGAGEEVLSERDRSSDKS